MSVEFLYIAEHVTPNPVPKAPRSYPPQPIPVLLWCISHLSMASTISAINARIRANPALSYVCSTRMSILNLEPDPARPKAWNSSLRRADDQPQTSGARCPTSASLWRPSWTSRRILRCELELLLLLRCLRRSGSILLTAGAFPRL